MWKFFRVHDEPKLSQDPLLLVCVSTSIPQYQMLYSQARELADFLLKNLDFKRIASLYSSAMPPAVTISKEGIVDLIGVDFHHFSSQQRDIVLFAGYSSPREQEYEFAHEVLLYAQRLGVKELISVGARWTESPISPFEKPRVMGFATDALGVERLKNNKVEPLGNEQAFYFANLVVAMAPLYGIRGYKLSVDHGEPRPHPKTLLSFLEVLSKFGLSVDTSRLAAEAKEFDKSLQKSVVAGEVMPGPGEEEAIAEPESDKGSGIYG